MVHHILDYRLFEDVRLNSALVYQWCRQKESSKLSVELASSETKVLEMIHSHALRVSAAV